MLRTTFPILAAAMLLGVLVLAPAADVPAEKIEKLVQQLGAENFEQRERASKALLEIGEPAVEELRKAANGPDREIALRAKKLLQDLGAAPKKPAKPEAPKELAKVPENIQKLIEQLGDDKFEV